MALGASLCAGLSCSRRAPGPDECHDAAVRMLLSEQARAWGGLPVSEANLPEDEVLARTTECITTPYDRKLVRCLTAGVREGSCVRAFEERRGAPLPGWQP